MSGPYHSLIEPNKVKIYRTKIGSAIMSHLFERYDDIGISVAPESYCFDRSEAVGYLLEDKILILFQIIDDRFVFRESNIETFAKLEMVSTKSFKVFLQKVLFETTYENLIAVIQLKIDEILFVSGGCSLKKAHKLAMLAHREDSYKSMAERKIKYPGKRVLKSLIRTYNGNIREISGDPKIDGADKSTVARWINEDSELQKLAQEQRTSNRIGTTSKATKSRRKAGRKKTKKTPSNPGKEILEALLINYEGNLQEMAENPNIRTSVRELKLWLAQEGITHNSG